VQPEISQKSDKIFVNNETGEFDFDGFEEEIAKSSEPAEPDSPWTDDTKWDNFGDLEKALDDDSVAYDEDEAENVANELEEVRVALENEGIKVEDVLKEFHVEIEDDLLQVTTVPAEELKAAEEHRMQAELERVRHEAEIQRRRENILEERAKEAREELHEDAKKKRELLEQKKRLLILKSRLEQEKLDKAFNRAESHLGKVIQEQGFEHKNAMLPNLCIFTK